MINNLSPIRLINTHSNLCRTMETLNRINTVSHALQQVVESLFLHNFSCRPKDKHRVWTDPQVYVN
jgi:hypothetical protein